MGGKTKDHRVFQVARDTANTEAVWVMGARVGARVLVRDGGTAGCGYSSSSIGISGCRNIAFSADLRLFLWSVIYNNLP